MKAIRPTPGPSSGLRLFLPICGAPYRVTDVISLPFFPFLIEEDLSQSLGAIRPPRDWKLAFLFGSLSVVGVPPFSSRVLRDSKCRRRLRNFRRGERKNVIQRVCDAFPFLYLLTCVLHSLLQRLVDSLCLSFSHL